MKVRVKYKERIAVWTQSESVLIFPDNMYPAKELVKKMIKDDLEDMDKDQSIDWTENVEVLERNLDDIEIIIEDKK